MALPTCPKCGHSAVSDVTSCPDCGQELKNGTVLQSSSPNIPAEVSGWVRYTTPPEMIMRARATFNEEEFMAEVREIERTGGLRLEDFIEELEEEVIRRERTNQ